MSAFGDEPPRLSREARLAAACEADPALAAELELICSQLDVGTRERFGEALGEELERHARPAAAVLAALGRAALGRAALGRAAAPERSPRSGD